MHMYYYTNHCFFIGFKLPKRGSCWWKLCKYMIDWILECMFQLPDLHQLMVEAAQILNIEPPNLYVRQSPVPNAYTLAISGKKPFVVVHTSLVELLTRKELQVPIHFKLFFQVYPQVYFILAVNIMIVKCKHLLVLNFTYFSMVLFIC